MDFDKLEIKQEKVLGTNKRIIILDTLIDMLSMDETVDLVNQYIKTNTPLHLIGVNADKINELNKNQKMKEIVNKCGIINADGASVVLASKFLNKKLPERVAGIDLMDRIVELCSKENYSVYLLGAKEEVVSKTKTVLEQKYKGVNIIGFRNGYFDYDQWDKIADELLSLNPDVIFVGITSPLKEYLVEFLQNKGLNSVLMGVGGSFDVISGSIPRAPLWVQKINMEWMFRVIQEPKRLFKRYFVGNFTFIKNVIFEKISK
ncbi:MAG: WecB/TagA/CpsF family glycosyltransferase [Erysipelotrichaceae bacterium]|nr:WecB/TagA/CpsF family glycosyltransferase [Erysipelotrichaceae bacterium]